MCQGATKKVMCGFIPLLSKIRTQRDDHIYVYGRVKVDLLEGYPVYKELVGSIFYNGV